MRIISLTKASKSSPHWATGCRHRCRHGNGQEATDGNGGSSSTLKSNKGQRKRPTLYVLREEFPVGAVYFLLFSEFKWLCSTMVKSHLHATFDAAKPNAWQLSSEVSHTRALPCNYRCHHTFRPHPLLPAPSVNTYRMNFSGFQLC